MAAAVILDIKHFKFLTVGHAKTVELLHCAKLWQNRSNSGRHMMIFIIQDGGRRHLGLLKFQIVNRRNAQEGRTASSCQISSKSLKQRPIYDDISISQDGGRRHVGFSKFKIFNGRNGQKDRTASPCQISSKSLQPWPRYRDFSIFLDGECRHLGFLKFQILNSQNAQEGPTAAEIVSFNIMLVWLEKAYSRPPFWGWGRVGHISPKWCHSSS